MTTHVNFVSMPQTSARQVEAAQQSAAEAALAARAAADAAAAAARQSGGNLNRDELRQQIQTAIRAARDAARDAARSEGGERVVFDPQNPVPPPPPDAPFPPGVPGPGGFNYSSEVPPELISAIRDTTPRVVSMLGVTLVCLVVGYPLARAIARWIDRRGAKAPAVSPDMDNRLRGIEQAVESIAVEVERISEGQRFTTKLLNERTQQPAPDFRGGSREREMAGAASAPLSSSKL